MFNYSKQKKEVLLTTKLIIEKVSEIIINEYNNQFPITYEYDMWLLEYNKHLEKINKTFNKKHKFDLFTLKNDAIQKIMNKHFINAVSLDTFPEWNRTHVRGKYEKNIRNCDIIYYPAKNPKKIIFLFSSMGQDKYNGYSRYWDITEKWESDTTYVFFKDESSQYYLGSEGDNIISSYNFLIKYFMKMNNLETKNCITIGNSMGGYAALYYGITLGLKGVIVSSPQINKNSVLMHEYRNWEKHINKIGSNFIDIDILICRFNKIPNIYIEYGNYTADLNAVNDLKKAIDFQSTSTIILNKMNDTEHILKEIFNKEKIDQTINYLHII